jgi:hypothetical protein
MTEKLDIALGEQLPWRVLFEIFSRRLGSPRKSPHVVDVKDRPVQG